MAKALRLMESVAGGDRPASIAELAAALHLSKSTAYRIGGALENLGYLAREPGTRRFTEGKRLVDLALNILRVASTRAPRHGILLSLSEMTGETCNLGVMSGTEAVCLDRVETAWTLGLRFEPGSRIPLHCTAIGKLFLSYLPDNRLRDFISLLPLTRYTQNTIAENKRLSDEVTKIRRRDFALDDREFMAGVICVAVPVIADDGGLIAGLALAAPETRMTLDRARECVPILRDAARKMSKTFSAGY